jgi:outer membrane protein assembly factor BamB
MVLLRPGMRDTWPMRRALLVLASGLAVAAAPADAGAQATTFQGGPTHAGNVRDSGLSPPLRRAWARRLPGTMSFAVIADGRVFVAASKGQYRGSEVLALSARTGRVLWRRDGYAIGYDEGRLYVSDATSERSTLTALAPADGRVLWERAIGFGAAPPVAVDGVVYLSSGWMEAYRGVDGALLWQTLLNGGDGIPAVAGDVVYLSFSCERYALARATGRVLWSDADGCNGGSGGSTPVLHAGRLYVREGDPRPPGEVYDAATGASVARMRADYAPAFAGGLGVFPDADLPGESRLFGHTLVARSVGDMRARWRFDGDGYLDTAPLIVDGTVYVGSGSGRLYGLSLRSGRVTWRTHLRRPIIGSYDGLGHFAGLAAGGGLLVVPAYRRLVAFR